jgi:ADP-ribose pyrophosphatase YjhB (NUDIX family)
MTSSNAPDPSIAFSAPEINFCSVCAAPVKSVIPPDDNRLRHVCTRCGTIHYQNPKLVIGAIPAWETGILLCRRAIEPRYGKWTLPAGFMENGETVAEAAMRETVEEAGAHIELGDMFSILSVPHINQVHVFYSARLLDLDFAAGVESLEVRLFDEASVPWEELAFRTVARTLKLYFEDRRTGAQRLHSEAILPRPG